MRLFIAEKPSLGRAIAAELGVTQNNPTFQICGSDTVTWCFGHITSGYGAGAISPLSPRNGSYVPKKAPSLSSK